MPAYISGLASDAARDGERRTTFSSGSSRLGSKALTFGVLKQEMIASVKLACSRYRSTLAVSSCNLQARLAPVSLQAG